jgi:hypothetical protein
MQMCIYHVNPRKTLLVRLALLALTLLPANLPAAQEAPSLLKGTASITDELTLCISEKNAPPNTLCRNVRLWGVEVPKEDIKAHALMFMHSLKLEEHQTSCEEIDAAIPTNPADKFGLWKCFFDDDENADKNKNDIARSAIRAGWLVPARYIRDQQANADKIKPYLEDEKKAIQASRGFWSTIVLDVKSIDSSISALTTEHKEIQDWRQDTNDGIVQLNDAVASVSGTWSEIVLDLVSVDDSISTLSDRLAKLEKTPEGFAGAFWKASPGALAGGATGLLTGLMIPALRTRRQNHIKLARAATRVKDDLNDLSFNPANNKAPDQPHIVLLQEHLKDLSDQIPNIGNASLRAAASDLERDLKTIVRLYEGCFQNGNCKRDDWKQVWGDNKVDDLVTELANMVAAASAIIWKERKLASK